MLNYLRGELCRLLCKKSMYLYFGAIALAYALLVFIRLDAGEQALRDAETLFGLLPALVGGYLFAGIYTDDLHAKNLSVLIGFGLPRAAILLAKLALMALLAGVVMGLAPLFLYGVYGALGAPASAGALGPIYAWAFKAFMETLAFGSLAAVAVYGLQRAVFGMVTYVLLALGVVSQLVGLLLNWDLIRGLLPGLSDHLMAGISLRTLLGLLSGASVAQPLAEYGVYLAATAALSLLAFHQKELEF
jgi:ABC-type transport system involved in multi-copper enzyme maturation permease subunit